MKKSDREGCVDSSVVEHRLHNSGTQVQLPVQEPGQIEADVFELDHIFRREAGNSCNSCN